MNTTKEQFERAARADRLKQARLASGYGGVKAVARKFGWSINTYKAHDSGQNGFGVEDARKYAKAFGVSLQWLTLGTGLPEDVDEEPINAIDVPLISMISAGQLSGHDGITDFSEFRRITAIGLADGDWIALGVEGNSMNLISPPGSIIFVNRRDRRLSHNACYVVADEQGNATYKRYREGMDPPFQPASSDDKVEPPKFDGMVTVIGRVRRSVLDM